MQLEEGEFAPFTYLQCGKLALRLVSQAKRANQPGTLVEIDLTEENATVVITSAVGTFQHGVVIFHGILEFSRELLNMENEGHRNVVDAYGAIFIPTEEQVSS